MLIDEGIISQAEMHIWVGCIQNGSFEHIIFLCLQEISQFIKSPSLSKHVSIYFELRDVFMVSHNTDRKIHIEA